LLSRASPIRSAIWLSAADRVRGDAADLPPQLLRDFLDAVAAGMAGVPIGRVYRFDQIVEAHTDMEQNRVSGKLVVTT
jgi:NADPH:quinone reductase